MPYCPHCKTATTEPFLPCPMGDGYYTLNEEDIRANRDEPLIGWPVAGRFVVTGLLGRGTMARVFRARQLEVDRDVALKIFSRESLIKENLSLHDQEAAAQMAKERFVQEAKVLAKLQHPNCVTLYDFGVGKNEEFLFIAMELVQGISLRTAANRRLKFPAILEIAQQILLALREAHGVGIVHRDLKPENIILSFRPGSEEQVVKVVDFGIARMLGTTTDGHTLVGTLFGTPAYMSPEQCRGETLTIRAHSDIYSLGCILYELICGKLPYAASTPQEMVRQHVQAPPPDVIVRAGLRVPFEFVDFVSKCLQKDPTDRFATAHEALQALSVCGAEADATGSTSSHMRRAVLSGPAQSFARVSVPEDRVRGDYLDAPRVEVAEVAQPQVSSARQQSASGSASVYETHPPGTLQAQVKTARSNMPVFVLIGFVLILVVCVGALFFVYSRLQGN